MRAKTVVMTLLAFLLFHTKITGIDIARTDLMMAEVTDLTRQPDIARAMQFAFDCIALILESCLNIT